jgi:hypothetical protein
MSRAQQRDLFFTGSWWQIAVIDVEYIPECMLRCFRKNIAN